jgi:probable rRNA maturation factor
MADLRLSVQGHSRFKGLPARATLARWIGLALEREADITLRFVGAAEGRRLNRDYRGMDHATNVLTFDYARAPAVHADIVLCVPVIRREAREHAREMEAIEIAILARLGLPDPYQEPAA